MSARKGQELVAGIAALSRINGVIVLAPRGWQAVGIHRLAAGCARVEPVPFTLAGEWSGLAVAWQEAAMHLVGAVAQARLGESRVVVMFLHHLSAEQRIIIVLWKRAVVIMIWGGVCLVDNDGFSLLRAHGFIILFRCVVVAAQVSAQLAIWC